MVNEWWPPAAHQGSSVHGWQLLLYIESDIKRGDIPSCWRIELLFPFFFPSWFFFDQLPPEYVIRYSRDGNAGSIPPPTNNHTHTQKKLVSSHIIRENDERVITGSPLYLLYIHTHIYMRFTWRGAPVSSISPLIGRDRYTSDSCPGRQFEVKRYTYTWRIWSASLSSSLIQMGIIRRPQSRHHHLHIFGWKRKQEKGRNYRISNPAAGGCLYFDDRKLLDFVVYITFVGQNVWWA